MRSSRRDFLAFCTAALVNKCPVTASDKSLALAAADQWHLAGYRGQGVKVAILDTGFRGYREYLGTCLPSNVEVRSFRRDRDIEAKDSRHGILCAEIIHTLAPEADLILANWEPDASSTFVDAVEWARKAGAHVISCSVIMPSWSDGEGGGGIHAALNEKLGSGDRVGDPLGVACAGNVARRHWSGTFRDSGNGFHVWPDKTIDNVITAWGTELVSVEMNFPPQSDLSLQVVDERGEWLGRPIRPTGIADSVVIRFVAEAKKSARVRVHTVTTLRENRRPGRFHLTVLGAHLDQCTERGSIPFPGDGTSWLTIGAWENNRRAEYSSCGPNSATPKPDLVAAVPVPSNWRAEPFGGTSAAAPQAAAAAALIWSRYPKLTATSVKSILRSAAHDVLSPGFDYESGFGLLRLPEVAGTTSPF